jgi:hypothetical protein
MKIARALVFFAMGTIWAAAGDYQIKAVKVLPVESYPARTEVSGVTIAGIRHQKPEFARLLSAARDRS